MKYDPERHHRRSIRLKGYDYAQAGAYFITIATQDRACLFGVVADGRMHLNEAGRMVFAEWDALPTRYPMVELDAFVVMPNHVHGIIVITNKYVVGATLVVAQTDITTVGAGLVPALENTMPTDRAGTGTRATTRVAPTIPKNDNTATPAVGDVVGAFKSVTTKRYVDGVKQCGWPAFRGRLWQRNYYEHVIRADESPRRIRQYILDNPARWAMDRENPTATQNEPEDQWPA